MHGLTYRPQPLEYKMMDTKYKVMTCEEIQQCLKTILIEPYTLYHKGGILETRLLDKLFTMFKCVNIEDVYYSTKDDISIYFKQSKTLCDKSIYRKLMNTDDYIFI